MRLVLITLVPVSIFVLGMLAGRASAPRTDLGKTDRKELSMLRDLRMWLTGKTAEHQLLGDNFAFTVAEKLDELNQKGKS